MQKRFLVIFGSGEISPTGRRIHDYIFKQIGKDKIAVSIITTPAGFQPNVVYVHQRIAKFFNYSLKNYHPKVDIIYANSIKEANNPDIIQPLNDADYIFIGPGSPTYAVENLKDTLLLRKLIDKIKTGATLALSSAAAIAFSQFALPVYEIYKAGIQLSWENGLNFYSLFFAQLTIIPHLNNQEGGVHLDTSFCFIGKDRFKKLFKLLPQNVKIWGIEEQTAVVINLYTKNFFNMGKGKMQEITRDYLE